MKSKKLVIIALQEGFLQMSYEQIVHLVGDSLEVRAASLNELAAKPPMPEETIFYFTPGLQGMVKKLYPECKDYFHAQREALIVNMKEFFALQGEKRILVINDGRQNTDDLLEDLRSFGLEHSLFPYYPGQDIPPDIDCILTSGERMLVPAELKDVAIIDIGLRFTSLSSIYDLLDHFQIPFDYGALARRYMHIMMMISEKWPLLGQHRFVTTWFGTRREEAAIVTFEDLVKKSSAMRKFVHHVERMAATEKPIHVYGAIGTEKKTILQAIHNGSQRKNGPFVSINCATRSPKTLERELFGWEEGGRLCLSLFEAAKGGTLCIEEIGELSIRRQAGLLQALSEKRIEHPGGLGYVEIDTRIVTTSSSRLDWDSGSFNRDLLLLLTQYTCRIPTLGERGLDFEPLVEQYLQKQLEKSPLAIDKETVGALKSYAWPGNVQELYNVLQYMFCTSDGVFHKDYLPYYIAGIDDPEEKGLGGDLDIAAIAKEIELHGFLAESIEILGIYNAGKQKNIAYGRATLQTILGENGFRLSTQQLRLKLEKLNDIGLLMVRSGRGGTTISEQGEQFYKAVAKETEQ